MQSFNQYRTKIPSVRKRTAILCVCSALSFFLEFVFAFFDERRGLFIFITSIENRIMKKFIILFSAVGRYSIINEPHRTRARALPFQCHQKPWHRGNYILGALLRFNSSFPHLGITYEQKSRLPGRTLDALKLRVEGYSSTAVASMNSWRGIFL